jgi:hypothetical protein
MRSIAITIFLAGIMFVFGSTANAQTKHKIGMKRALAIATKRVHGTLKAKELEKEKGRWIYSFEFRTRKGKIREVNVDAYSGKVIGVENESAGKEARETMDEKKPKN